MIHLDEPGQRCGAVLEQVVNVGDAVRGLRVARCGHHRAAGLEQHDDVTLEHAVGLAQHREDTTARACTVSRGDA